LVLKKDVVLQKYYTENYKTDNNIMHNIKLI